MGLNYVVKGQTLEFESLIENIDLPLKKLGCAPILSMARLYDTI